MDRSWTWPTYVLRTRNVIVVADGGGPLRHVQTRVRLLSWVLVLGGRALTNKQGQNHAGSHGGNGRLHERVVAVGC
jgi:hypothetical protein